MTKLGLGKVRALFPIIPSYQKRLYQLLLTQPLLTACSQSLNDWRYSGEENKSKSSIICIFYFKSMETDARRVNNWEAQGPRIANYSCLAAAQWADGAKAGRSLCRVCFVGRAEVDTIMRHAPNTFYVSNITFYLSHS